MSIWYDPDIDNIHIGHHDSRGCIKMQYNEEFWTKNYYRHSTWESCGLFYIGEFN